MRYPFYVIGVNQSDLSKADMDEQFCYKQLDALVDRHKQHLIELLRIRLSDLEQRYSAPKG